MAQITIWIGIALIALGLIGFLVLPAVMDTAASPTALIPTAFGFALILLGVLARSEARRKMAMHIAVLIGLLGVAGAARAVPGLLDMLSGNPVARPAAVLSQGVMFVLMLVFVGLCVNSFVQARRQRG
jgi:cytochrome bd-type quinol oxidase subunit 1